MNITTQVGAFVPAAYTDIIGAWTPSAELAQWGKWIAAALLTFWVLYILFKMVTPKKGATRQINWLGLGMSGVVAMLLMNMSAVPGIINNVGKLFYGLGEFIGIK
jgi:Mg2+/Co2+ transporter CorB